MNSQYEEYRRQMYELQRHQQYMAQMGMQNAFAQQAPADKPKDDLDRNSKLLLLEDVK